MRDRATYVAHVGRDRIEVYAEDWEHPAATIELPPGESLRDALAKAGWWPTGRRAPSGDPGAIYVEPISRRC